MSLALGPEVLLLLLLLLLLAWTTTSLSGTRPIGWVWDSGAVRLTRGIGPLLAHLAACRWLGERSFTLGGVEGRRQLADPLPRQRHGRSLPGWRLERTDKTGSRRSGGEEQSKRDVRD